MALYLLRSSQIKAMTLLLFLMTSCTYRHWVKPDEFSVRQNETVYRLVTLDGDTVSFAGSHCVERERNRLTGISGVQFAGHGGIYEEGIVSGVNGSGEEISFPEEDINVFEIPDRTAMVGTVSIILVSIPAAALILGGVLKSSYEGNSPL